MSQTEPMTPPELLNQDRQASLAPQSIMEGLRRQRAEAEANTTVDITLPEFRNPELVARFGLVDPDALARMGKKVTDETAINSERVILGAIDTVIAACQGLYARESGSSVLIPLGTEDQPMVFDNRLAEFLGIDDRAESARDVVRLTFGNNPFAIIDVSMKLTRWMSDRKADLGEQGLGEV